jgi:adenine deaminase
VLLPETLADGALDVAVRRIIAAGVRPIEAIAVASVNAGESFRADFDMGSISPGRFAEAAAYRQGFENSFSILV